MLGFVIPLARARLALRRARDAALTSYRRAVAVKSRQDIPVEYRDWPFLSATSARSTELQR
jgi:hypothetical protein